MLQHRRQLNFDVGLKQFRLQIILGAPFTAAGGFGLPRLQRCVVCPSAVPSAGRSSGSVEFRERYDLVRRINHPRPKKILGRPAADLPPRQHASCAHRPLITRPDHRRYTQPGSERQSSLRPFFRQALPVARAAARFGVTRRLCAPGEESAGTTTNSEPRFSVHRQAFADLSLCAIKTSPVLPTPRVGLFCVRFDRVKPKPSGTTFRPEPVGELLSG